MGSGRDGGIPVRTQGWGQLEALGLGGRQKLADSGQRVVFQTCMSCPTIPGTGRDAVLL